VHHAVAEGSEATLSIMVGLRLKVGASTRATWAAAAPGPPLDTDQPGGPGSRAPAPVPELHMSDALVEVARARGAAGAAVTGFGSGKETAAQLAATFGSGKETAAQLDARLETQFGSGNETAAQLDAQFGSGNETAAQLAAQFGSGEETAAQQAGMSRGGAKGRNAQKGRSKPSGVPGNTGPGCRKRKTEWPEGTVMAWCKCGAKGQKGKGHNKPMQKGEPVRWCGSFSLSAPPG
jgi:hypothetical protein